METTKKFIELLVQGLGIISIIVLLFFIGMMAGVISGNIIASDSSMFSEWARLLSQYPVILIVAGLFSFWSIKIWIKEEKQESCPRQIRRGRTISIQKPQH